jgi:integrase/recombinase XerD
MKASIYFDARKQIKSGENSGRSHIKILVEFDGDSRTRRYYQTGVFATRQEFNKIIKGQYGKSSVAESDELEEKRKALLALEKKAKDELRPWITPEEFEPRFRSEGNNDNPLDMLLAYSEELKREGQIGTAIYYKSAYSSFKKFCEEKYNGRLSFIQVTPKWLMSYEKWLLEQGRSISTVGTHVRPMRTVFKKAMDLGTLAINLYPFGRNKYKCPTSLGRKLALSETEKNKVLGYEGPYQHHVDLWKFSYFANGMNFNDIARLRRRDIVDGILTYSRTKTYRTERNKESTVITLRDEALRIINKWGSRNIAPGAYVFPILREGLTPLQEKHIIADWIKDVNASLKEACREIKIPKITTYWARHTFATTLKRNGASLEEIQEALGHADPRTTKLYLDSFDIETKRKISNML